jgi:catechol 2,3-dioxygenase-like lactoylglutathione lyase family enzyme
LDHLVLPVNDLSRARARLTALGFTVAADAQHPFGTANACVFLSDGTYLEPLAIANRRNASNAARRGNVFTSRDIAFRRTRNREGLSALVAATDDAATDHRRFQEAGFSAGDMLEFSRAMQLPDGGEAVASFRLAFASEVEACDLFLFACQRINPLPADRGELERHMNAVTGLARVILSSETPAAVAPLLATVFEAEPVADGDNLLVETGNVPVRVVPKDSLVAEFALEPDLRPGSGLSARAVIFKTSDLAVTEITLAANDVAFIRREGRVLVAATSGQGVLFGFEE